MKLFVYGTLRRGESAAHLMRDARFVGVGSIRALRRANGQYSGIIPGEGVVEGELYEAPASLIPSLDEYEGAAYQRRPCVITLSTGETIEGWAYFNARASDLPTG